MGTGYGGATENPVGTGCGGAELPQMTHPVGTGYGGATDTPCGYRLWRSGTSPNETSFTLG